MQDQIEAQQQHESLLRVSTNSELLQTTAQKHRWMNSIERHLNQQADFSCLLGIHVYEPERMNDEVIWHLRRNPPAKLTNILTIGVYKGHAFVIKNISKTGEHVRLRLCQARFTQACHLQWHNQRCAQGKTVIDCPAERVEAQQTAFEKAFYPKHCASQESLRWLEREAERRKIHIHHAMCGHSGERWVGRAPVDGYNNETRTVFQYHDCHWHRCRKCYPNDRDKIIAYNDQTREDQFKATVKCTKALRDAGFRVIEAWACQVGEMNSEPPRPQMRSYPHVILYDFEAYGDKNQWKEPTGMLTIENVHVPILVSVGDTLEREPTHICEKDPAELVRKFMEELERREKNIRTKVRATFKPDDVRMLLKVQRLKIEDEKLEKVQNILSCWKYRRLTLIGKIAVLKSLVVSQLVYVLSPLNLNAKATKEVNKLFYSFLWNGKGDKIKRNIIINEYQNGGLRMIDIESFCKSLKATWIKKYLDEENQSKWKILFDLELEAFGGTAALTNNLNTKDTKDILKSKDSFISEVLTIWAEANFEDCIISENHFLNQSL